MKKKLLAGLVVTAMVVSMVGCGSSSSSSSDASSGSSSASSESTSSESSSSESASASSDDEVWTIGLEYSASSCEFCQKFADECKAYGEEKGFNVIITQGNRNVSNQITNAEGMLEQGAKIVGGFWDDPDACMTIKDACEEKDVWCIGVLTSLTDRGNGYEKYRHVGSENVEGGRLYGEYAAEHLPENAQICELHGVSSDIQDQERFQGFWEAMEEAGRDDVTVLDVQYTNTNREEGLKVVENWLQAYPEMDAFVSYSDELTVAGVEALRSAGVNGKVQVYSFDGSNEGAQMVLDGDIMCDVLQDYKEQAHAYIDLCVNIRDTGTSDDIEVPFTLITQENAEDYLDY